MHVCVCVLCTDWFASLKKFAAAQVWIQSAEADAAIAAANDSIFKSHNSKICAQRDTTQRILGIVGKKRREENMARRSLDAPFELVPTNLIVCWQRRDR